VKILLVEDDKQTSDYIAKGLREHGHVVDQADNGRDGLYLATGEKYDVMVVDRMLPSMDGLSLVKAARTSNVRTPVLFLTTMGGIDDRVAGFDAGGDDYLVKPFAFAELLARVGALARRPPIVATTSLSVGDLEMDLVARKVTRAGRKVELTLREFELLEYVQDDANDAVRHRVEHCPRVARDDDVNRGEHVGMTLRIRQRDDRLTPPAFVLRQPALELTEDPRRRAGSRPHENVQRQREH